MPLPWGTILRIAFHCLELSWVLKLDSCGVWLHSFLTPQDFPGWFLESVSGFHLPELPAVRNKGTWARSLLNGIISSPWQFRQTENLLLSRPVVSLIAHCQICSWSLYLDSPRGGWCLLILFCFVCIPFEMVTFQPVTMNPPGTIVIVIKFNY